MCVDHDYSEPLTSETRRARKEHRCWACREIIPIGHRYHYTAQLNDGHLDVFKHCARCWAILDAILDAGAEAVQWDLHCGESWEENFGPLPDSVARLAFITPDEAQRETA